MANIKKLQEAMDLLLNEEDEAADAALHEYFVGLARKINEQFQDAELEEAEMDFDNMGGDISTDMDEIDQEEGVIEDEFPGEEGFEDEIDADVPEDELGDLRDELENLLAKFDEIVGDSPENEFGDDEFADDELGGIEDEVEDENIGFDDAGDDEEMSDNPFESVDLDEADDEELDEADELDETLREYTEKVAAPSNVEGKEVGTGPTGAVEKGQLLNPKGNLKGGNAKPHPSTGGEAKGYAAPKKGKVGSIKGTADNKVKGKAKSSQKAVPKVANTEGGEIGSGGKNRGVDKAQLLKQRGGN